MALTATHTGAAGESALSGIKRFFAALGRGLIAIGESHPRMKRLERLQGLSDQELAKMGLKREDIPRYVFSDYI